MSGTCSFSCPLNGEVLIFGVNIDHFSREKFNRLLIGVLRNVTFSCYVVYFIYESCVLCTGTEAGSPSCVSDELVQSVVSYLGKPIFALFSWTLPLI
jgi:hypothetical protein